MSRTLLRSLLLLAVAAFLGTDMVIERAPVLAASTGPDCPPGTVCDHALGIAPTPPSGWRRLPAGKLPLHTIGLFALPVSGPSYNVRLIVASSGTTQDKNDVRAADHAAREFIRGYSRLHMRPPLVRVPVRYGGAPGVMILNLPGQPTLVVVIILAHHGVLYRIVAPGATLAHDQHGALNSVRFIPRVGPFPSANPSAPRGRLLHRSIPGGVFGRSTLTLTPVNGFSRLAC